MMDEAILLAITALDETEALRVVEPLHCTCRTHCLTPDFFACAGWSAECSTYRHELSCDCPESTKGLHDGLAGPFFDRNLATRKSRVCRLGNIASSGPAST